MIDITNYVTENEARTIATRMFWRGVFVAWATMLAALSAWGWWPS